MKRQCVVTRRANTMKKTCNTPPVFHRALFSHNSFAEISGEFVAAFARMRAKSQLNRTYLANSEGDANPLFCMHCTRILATICPGGSGEPSRTGRKT